MILSMWRMLICKRKKIYRKIYIPVLLYIHICVLMKTPFACSHSHIHTKDISTLSLYFIPKLKTVNNTFYYLSISSFKDIIHIS